MPVRRWSACADRSFYLLQSTALPTELSKVISTCFLTCASRYLRLLSLSSRSLNSACSQLKLFFSLQTQCKQLTERQQQQRLIACTRNLSLAQIADNNKFNGRAISSSNIRMLDHKIGKFMVCVRNFWLPFMIVFTFVVYDQLAREERRRRMKQQRMASFVILSGK